MLQQIKKAVGFNDVKSICDKSASIIDVFTRTINELSEVNNQAKEAVNVRNEQITKLEIEKSKLNDVINHNTKVANKLNLILSE